MISSIIRFLERGIWEMDTVGRPLFVAWCIRCLRIVVLAVRGFLDDKCALRASALTYYSVLSIVPTLAMVFGIAKGFGLERLVRRQVMDIAERTNWPEEAIARILAFSNSMLEHTKGGLIAGVGIVVLLWAIISILSNIEESFNHIWGVKHSRTLVRKFTDYTALLVFTPFLLIISSSATVIITSQVEVIINRLFFLGVVGSLILFLLEFLPYLVIWVLLTFSYIIIPNTRVPIRSAVVAGITTGTLYQIVQFIYITFQIGVAKYGAIYGSFAALPLFVVWLNLSWMIVLFGAEIAFAFENQEHYGFSPDFSRLTPFTKRILVLLICQTALKRFEAKERPMTLRQMSKRLRIPQRFCKQLTDELTARGLMVEATGRRLGESTFQPAMPGDSYTIQGVLEAYEGRGLPEAPKGAVEDVGRLSGQLRELSLTVMGSPANVNLRDL